MFFLLLSHTFRKQRRPKSKRMTVETESITTVETTNVKELEDELDGQLADHLLQTVELELSKLPKDSNGLLIEASLAFSSLFTSKSAQLPPALALFSYSATAFTSDDKDLTAADFNVVEIHSFDDFETAYESAKESFQNGGGSAVQLDGGEIDKKVVFAISDGTLPEEATEFSVRFAQEFGLKHVQFGGDAHEDLSETLKEVEGQLADHLLETVRVEIQKVKERDYDGLIISASLPFSPLFSTPENPSIILFSYPSTHFSETPSTLPPPTLTKINPSDPPESVYTSIRSKITVAESPVYFVFNNGTYTQESHLLAVRIASDYKFKLVTFAGIAPVITTDSEEEEEEGVEVDIVVENDVLLDDVNSDLNSQLAEQILEVVRAGLVGWEGSVLVEASMSYSPLFQASESAPALALFAYPADHFDDGENIPSFKKSFSVVEVHSFEPFDVVYESVKTRVEAEGMVKNGRTVIFAIVNGESGDAAVICEKLVGEYGLKSVKFGGEEEGDAGIVVESDVAIEDVDEEISAQIAEHLLESVRVEVGKAKENKAAGLIVEASLGFSPLFDSSSDSEEKPALALFAYPAEHFDDSELVDLSNALNVIEVHSFEPFESVVESVKKSLKREGLVDGFNVIFAIGSGASNEQSHLLCVKLAEEFGLSLFQFGSQ